MNILKVPLQIFRYKPGQAPRYDTFTVEIPATAHVIDAIDAVWAIHDQSVAFRRACHHSSCGSCAIRINGVEKLPCITRVADVWDGHDPLRFEPLRNFPIVSDLVVDVTGLFQRMSAADMSMICEAEAFLPFTVDTFAVADLDPKLVELPENFSRFSRFEKCIECGWRSISFHGADADAPPADRSPGNGHLVRSNGGLRLESWFFCLLISVFCILYSRLRALFLPPRFPQADRNSWRSQASCRSAACRSCRGAPAR